MDVRYVGHLAHLCKPRDARACRTPPENFDHLSLAAIVLREKLDARKRQGEALSPVEAEVWARLMRKPRHPPIYDEAPAPLGAA